VLWVDDHPENMAEHVEAWSKSLGIVFRQATSSEEAYRKLAEERFDLVLSDIGRQGEENTGQVTLDIVAGRAPVVFFTNKRGLNLRNTLLRAGAMDVTDSLEVLRELLQREWRKKFGIVEETPDLDFSGIPSENVVTQQKQAKKKASKPDGRVRRDQGMLKQLGFYEGEVDGVASDDLKNAIRNFQSSMNLITDGIAGPQTRAAMEQAIAQQQQQSQPPQYSQSYAAPNAAPDFDDNSTYVYIEYASVNEEQAQHIAGYLEDNDIEAILDIKYMRSGEEIRAFIQRSMDVCEAAIFLVSSAALQSPTLVKSLDYLFGSEFSRKKFFCCALDMEFRDTAYLSKAMLEIESKIKSLEGGGYAQSQSAYGSYGDNVEELKSYMEMRELSPKIINQLSHVQLIDISGNNFERGMREIVNFLRPPTRKRPVFK
jgi:peptidoglycan hydrolase-like protein with peptidoglycan-binding domain